MNSWLSKYWSWLFIFVVGPLVIYVTVAGHLQNAPVSPILPFLIAVLFLPPWEAGIGFFIAVSYSTLQRLGVVQPSLYISKIDTIARVILLILISLLIIYVKKRLTANTELRVKLEREDAKNKALVHELSSIEQKIRSILDSQPVAVVVSNRKGDITYVNSAATSLFEYKKNEMESLHIADLVPLKLRHSHKEQREKFFDNPESRSENPHGEFSVGVKSDGSEIQLRISLGWFELNDELLVVATLEDVEELRRETSRANEAESMVRIRDRFLSLAAHELKTPIASIILYADLLRIYYTSVTGTAVECEKNFKAKKQQIDKALRAIERQSLSISLMINQFLDISLIRDFNFITIHREHIKTCELLEGIVDVAQLQTAKHKIILDCPEEMDGYVDRIRLEQIVINLLNNAIKYSPNGGDIIVTGRELGGHAARISVRDHGIGIPPDKRDKIFTRFFRAHPDVSSGLGLGLFLSKEIIEAHHGSITFSDPEDGQGGTVFTVSFPPEHETIESRNEMLRAKEEGDHTPGGQQS